jgi:hypothetical protein
VKIGPVYTARTSTGIVSSVADAVEEIVRWVSSNENQFLRGPDGVREEIHKDTVYDKQIWVDAILWHIPIETLEQDHCEHKYIWSCFSGKKWCKKCGEYEERT